MNMIKIENFGVKILQHKHNVKNATIINNIIMIPINHKY